VEFHNRRGDFESWAQNSLQDKVLYVQLVKIRESKQKGDALRQAIADAATTRFSKLNKQVQAAAQLF
jgi:hypothetical protein